MNKDFINKIKDNEVIVIRNFTSDSFIVRRISSIKDNSNYNLVGLVKNPIVSNAKSDGVLFKIGIVSKESLCTSTPIDVFTRLVVDYDNESNNSNLLSEFCNRFKKYSFILYTSWSSTPLKPRFRVIIKIKNVLFSSYLKDANYRKYLVDLFTIGDEKPDESCFYPHQCQLLPIVKNKSCYKYVINKGVKLKLTEYEDVAESVRLDVKRQTGSYVIQDVMPIIQSVSYTNLFVIDSKELKKHKKKLNISLLKIRHKDFCKTREYKNAVEQIEQLQSKKKQTFANKNEFLLTVLPKAVGNKDINYFFNEWKLYYHFDIRKNSKWNKKFEEFLPKVMQRVGVKNIKELL